MKTRTKRRITEILGWLCLFGMLVIVGGTERGWLPMTAIWWVFGLLAVGAAALYKAGVVRL